MHYYCYYYYYRISFWVWLNIRAVNPCLTRRINGGKMTRPTGKRRRPPSQNKIGTLCAYYLQFDIVTDSLLAGIYLLPISIHFQVKCALQLTWSITYTHQWARAGWSFFFLECNDADINTQNMYVYLVVSTHKCCKILPWSCIEQTFAWQYIN